MEVGGELCVRLDLGGRAAAGARRRGMREGYALAHRLDADLALVRVEDKDAVLPVRGAVGPEIERVAAAGTVGRGQGRAARGAVSFRAACWLGRSTPRCRVPLGWPGTHSTVPLGANVLRKSWYDMSFSSSATWKPCSSGGSTPRHGVGGQRRPPCRQLSSDEATTYTVRNLRRATSTARELGQYGIHAGRGQTGMGEHDARARGWSC